MIHAGKKYANKAALRGAVINASNYCGVAVRVRANRSNQQRISFGCHSVARNGDRYAEGACRTCRCCFKKLSSLSSSLSTDGDSENLRRKTGRR